MFESVSFAPYFSEQLINCLSLGKNLPL